MLHSAYSATTTAQRRGPAAFGPPSPAVCLVMRAYHWHWQASNASATQWAATERRGQSGFALHQPNCELAASANHHTKRQAAKDTHRWRGAHKGEEAAPGSAAPNLTSNC